MAIEIQPRPSHLNTHSYVLKRPEGSRRFLKGPTRTYILSPAGIALPTEIVVNLGVIRMHYGR